MAVGHFAALCPIGDRQKLFAQTAGDVLRRVLLIRSTFVDIADIMRTQMAILCLRRRNLPLVMLNPLIQYPWVDGIIAPERKRPGRKPGCEKPAGSGRQPGTKNKVSRDLRETILTRGKPLELLCDISRGVKIRIGPQAGPGDATYAYPSLQERAAAAKILLDKLVPAAGPVDGDQPAAPETDVDYRQLDRTGKRDIARRIAFALSSGLPPAPVKPEPTLAAPPAKPESEPITVDLMPIDDDEERALAMQRWRHQQAMAGSDMHGGSSKPWPAVITQAPRR